MNAPFRLVDTPERVKLSVNDFLLLNDSGAFAAYRKTELIDGEIWGMNAQHFSHARIKSRLAFEFERLLRESGSDLETVTEVTVRAAADSAPEPDIVLTRFRGSREVPADTVALVVEVGETTLARDMGRKATLYAAAGIPEYWVVDVDGGRVVLHWGAAADGYRSRSVVPIGGPLGAATIPGLDLGAVRLLD